MTWLAYGVLALFAVATIAAMVDDIGLGGCLAVLSCTGLMLWAVLVLDRA